MIDVLIPVTACIMHWMDQYTGYSEGNEGRYYHDPFAFDAIKGVNWDWRIEVKMQLPS